MLQNRVNPLGDIIRTPARGAWMGNRGLLHNERQEIVRPYRLIPWITCVLSFKNRHRPVMAPGQYTELFFLDEATSFAAGHRPCKECRREAHGLFKKYWALGNPLYALNEHAKIGAIDAVLHAERITVDNTKVLYEAPIGELPDGAFFLQDGKPFLIRGDKLYPWMPEGYGQAIDRPKETCVMVLTPRSVVNAFSAGYRPQMWMVI